MIITDEYYQLDNNDLVHMVNKTYDQMGQLTQKSLHGSGGSFAQTVDYSYNIRGWMTHINNVNALGVDAFAMELSYNNCNEGYYNGNIWKQSWKSIQFANEKTYEYSYDGANRLISAAYDERSLDLSAGPYEYDLNGNITHLVRNGYYDQNGEIDNLTY